MIFAQAGVAEAREMSERELKRIEEADKEREWLLVDLRELQHDGTSLDDILLFFRAIQTEVQNLVDVHNDPLLEQLDYGKEVTAEEKNELVKSMVRQQALEVKVRFTITQRLAQVYCEVSEQHILKGFDIIQRLSLFQSSMSEEDAERSDQTLEDYRKESTEGIEGLTRKEKRALIENLQSIVERDARGTIQKKIGPSPS